MSITNYIFLLKFILLKSIFNQYKSFFSFLGKFLLFYVVFAGFYSLYLKQFDASQFELDDISKNVAHQTVWLINFLGGDAVTYAHDFEPSMKIIFKEKFAARIVEGCNAISVIILFAAFVFAFSSSFKKTILYILSGAILIYFLNILRIALLTFALYYYPQYEELLHGTIFPLFIYGAVFLLWVLWVTKFSRYAN